MLLRRVTAPLAAALLALGGIAACSDKPTAAASGKIAVVAAFYPLQFITQRVGGDRVSVSNLVKPGAEPHDLELQPGQVRDLAGADLVVYLRGFQPAVDEAIDQQGGGKPFDVATVEPLADPPRGAESETAKDPHVWLDPVRLAAIVDKLTDRLVQLDKGSAADFRSRAKALRTDLETLDKEYAAGLANCQRHEIVTSHAAFGYLAARYHLTQIPITGIMPEEEPTPQRLAEVAKLAREKGVTTIFFETLVSPRVAETLAKEVGAKAEVLDPIEGIEPASSADYVSVMRQNLATLKPALGCT
jgi:zinc transport system substrate-binding protein